MTRRWKAALAAITMAAAVLLSGCSSGQATFAQAIPTALRNAGIGVTGAYAEQGQDSFTAYLAVGADIDRTELSPEDLGTILRVIADANDLRVDSMRLYVTNVDGHQLPLTQIEHELDQSLLGSDKDPQLDITIADARRLGGASAHR